MHSEDCDVASLSVRRLSLSIRRIPILSKWLKYNRSTLTPYRLLVPSCKICRTEIRSEMSILQVWRQLYNFANFSCWIPVVWVKATLLHSYHLLYKIVLYFIVLLTTSQYSYAAGKVAIHVQCLSVQVSTRPGTTVSIQAMSAYRLRTRTSTSPFCPSWSARCASVSADNLRRTFVRLCCCRVEQSVWFTQRHSLSCFQNHLKTIALISFLTHWAR